MEVTFAHPAPGFQRVSSTASSFQSPKVLTCLFATDPNLPRAGSAQSAEYSRFDCAVAFVRSPGFSRKDLIPWL